MIEFVNASAAALDLSGVTIADAVAVRATLPAGTVVAPGQALVVFGGAAPTLPGVVTVGTTGLYLNNGGDQLVVRRPDGAILAELAYGQEGGNDQSLVRETDADPDSPMVGHKTVATAPASPGTKSDGSPFGAEPPTAAQLLVNEVLADPPATYDANGDGVANTVADEFVELVNPGGAALDLSGATLADANQVRGTFAAGTVIAPGHALVVFGGGAPNLPGVATVVFAPLQLNNGGDTITIRAPDGLVLATVAYGAAGGMDQSLTRATDGDPYAELVLHGSVAPTVASPGRRVDGQPW
jgi:hypothetical protein